MHEFANIFVTSVIPPPCAHDQIAPPRQKRAVLAGILSTPNVPYRDKTKPSRHQDYSWPLILC
jgi:hypothetical protein